jgi:hypothetical protein
MRRKFLEGGELYHHGVKMFNLAIQNSMLGETWRNSRVQNKKIEFIGN